MATSVVSFGAALAGDVLSIIAPGSGVLGKIVDGYIEKKRAEAAQILIDEISNGHHGHIAFDEHDTDPLLEIMFRFSKAVSDGAAKDNLRLLAQIIAGQKKHRALDGDKFRKWCGILEGLTRNELMLVGTAYSIQSQASGAEDDPPFYKLLVERMDSKGYANSELQSLCASVSRTGLLLPMSAFGGLVYVPSEWLRELGKLADLENVAGLKG